jgi:hypothetical protein
MWNKLAIIRERRPKARAVVGPTGDNGTKGRSWASFPVPLFHASMLKMEKFLLHAEHYATGYTSSHP